MSRGAARLRHAFAELRLPLMAAPMSIATSLELVTAACSAGIVGCVHVRNARRSGGLKVWLEHVGNERARLERAGSRPGPVAVNLNVARRRPPGELREELDLCREAGVTIVTTNSGDPRQLIDEVHAWGGAVIHDATTEQHAQRAIDAGADGLMLVTAGAGGQGGLLNPFAFTSAVRASFDGVIVLAGGIADGAGIAAARVLGADLVCMGTRFIATVESGAPEGHKRMLTTARLKDVHWTNAISGNWSNFLAPSIREHGLDITALPPPGADGRPTIDRSIKAWSMVWSGGHSVGAIADVPTTDELVGRLAEEVDRATPPSLLARRSDRTGWSGPDPSTEADSIEGSTINALRRTPRGAI